MNTVAFVTSCICCGSILSLVQILFPLFQTHDHQITITKPKEIKFEPRIKLNHNIYTLASAVSSLTLLVSLCAIMSDNEDLSSDSSYRKSETINDSTTTTWPV